MSSSSLPPTSTDARPAEYAGRRRMVFAIGVMLAAFLAVVVLRQAIRVRFWQYRLLHAERPAERLYYVQLLAGAREAALPAAQELLESEEAGTRSYGVALLNGIPGEAAFALLGAACRDVDAGVRESAIVGLSLREPAEVVPALRELADHPDIETAMLAASRLDARNAPGALDALRELAVTHREAGVRAQAIVSLSTWPVERVADTLIACLGDDAVFAGRTATERGAMDALAFAAPARAAEAAGEGLGGLFGPVGESNGCRAARVLRQLTGESFGFIEASAEDRPAAIEAWRRWWAGRRAP